MTTMQSFCAPKSDQLNADDLVGSPRIIKIRKVVVKDTGEQRCHIFFEGDDNKPWKPCKTMGRILMEAWGDDPQKYIGKYVRIFRDPEASYGGAKLGGIRISALSDIPEAFTTAVTVSRGNKKPYKVEKLAPKVNRPDATPEELQANGAAAAAKGTEAYKSWFTTLTGSEKTTIGTKHDEWKKQAADIDAGAEKNTGESDHVPL